MFEHLDLGITYLNYAAHLFYLSMESKLHNCRFKQQLFIKVAIACYFPNSNDILQTRVTWLQAIAKIHTFSIKFVQPVAVVVHFSLECLKKLSTHCHNRKNVRLLPNKVTYTPTSYL